MNHFFKTIGLASLALAISACGTTQQDDFQSTNDSETEIESALSTARHNQPSEWVGQYRAQPGSAQGVASLALDANGRFHLDTGIRCIQPPCPSAIEGDWYGVTRFLVLSPDSGRDQLFRVRSRQDQPIELLGLRAQHGIHLVKEEPAPCFVGGCSSQLCTDNPGMISTCEWREEYACFQEHGVCERNAAGECGWRETPELTQCLNPNVPDFCPRALCAPGTRCDEETDSCVPDRENFCATVRCAPGFYCDEAQDACNPVCDLPLQQGLCRAYIPSWGFDAAAGECVQFIYGGCGGNANRFPSREICESQTQACAQPEPGFSCPADGMINCMPPLSGSLVDLCGGDYHQWIQANCPGVDFVY